MKAICAIYPPTEIRKFENTDPIFDAYKALMGDNAKEAAYANASPLLKIENEFPPTMLIHGSSDSVVKLSDSTNFYQKAQRACYLQNYIFSLEKSMPLILKLDMEDLIADLSVYFLHKYL